jgi:hypothetical protein
MREEKKRERGRPEKTIKDFKEGWEETILKMSREGASIVEIAVELNISRNTLSKMTDNDAYFLSTIKECKRLCEAWWLKKGRTELENKDFSYTGWYMNMKNRFGWTDRVDQTTKDEKISQVTVFKLPDNER